MRTLVGEGIRAFIVIRREHPLVGLKVFSFRNLLEAYFTGSFPYGNPFGFCEAWRASYFLIYTIRGWQANIDQYRQFVMILQLSPRQPHKGVSLMRASAQ